MATLVILSGSSGAGKTTVAEALVKERDWDRVVTTTTRKPRAGEVHGRDYYFVSPERFRQQQEQGHFVEQAEVYGTWYGTERAELTRIRHGKKPGVIILDVAGMRRLKQEVPEAMTVWLSPGGGVAELVTRLEARGLGVEELRKRTAQFEAEALAIPEYEFEVTNVEGELGETVAMIETLAELYGDVVEKADFLKWIWLQGEP